MNRFATRLLALAAPAIAQERSVKIVLGCPAGATSDVLSRTVGDRMRGTLGRPVIVESEAGAGGA